jgi:hypothetical protein
VVAVVFDGAQQGAQLQHVAIGGLALGQLRLSNEWGRLVKFAADCTNSVLPNLPDLQIYTSKGGNTAYQGLLPEAL